MSFEKVNHALGVVADTLDGYKVHIANVLTVGVQWYGWRKHWPFDAQMTALAVTAALVSLARMVARKPGPLA
jgi:hypothetical protein